MTILGERIRALRESKSLHQTELSKRLEITNVTLSRYEAGERNPDFSTLEKIADYFEVSVDYLLGRTNVTQAVHIETLSNKEVTLSINELRLIEELQKNPSLLNNLTIDPEKKVKELIKLYKIRNVILEDEAEYGFSGSKDKEVGR